MSIFLLTAGIFGIAMLIMAVGIMLKRDPLRGSCGGAKIWDCDGDEIACGACPNRAKKQAAARTSADEIPAA